MGRPSVVSFTHGGVARAEAVSPLTAASPIVEIETGGRERGGRFRFRLQGTETVVELARLVTTGELIRIGITQNAANERAVLD